MNRKIQAEIKKNNLSPHVFWNGELLFLFEKRYEHRYFRQFFLHICNYVEKEGIVRLFENDDMLRTMFFDNFWKIFEAENAKLITWFTYEVGNELLAMCWVDWFVLEEKNLFRDRLAEEIENAYLDWEFGKAGFRIQ